MVPQAPERLLHDHHEVGDIFQQLLAALHNTDVAATHSRLDLLWARLAVHIRAEHLHLFPVMLNRVSEAQSLVENLREDHDFFMVELARAIGILRELPTQINSAGDKAKLTAVGNTVRAVEKRLIAHNEVEEDQIYRWTSTALTETEQLELATRIDAELEKRPARFSAEAWANQ